MTTSVGVIPESTSVERKCRAKERLLVSVWVNGTEINATSGAYNNRMARGLHRIGLTSDDEEVGGVPDTGHGSPHLTAGGRWGRCDATLRWGLWLIPGECRMNV